MVCIIFPYPPRLPARYIPASQRGAKRTSTRKRTPAERRRAGRAAGERLGGGQALSALAALLVNEDSLMDDSSNDVPITLVATVPPGVSRTAVATS